jgi:pimeloyl-ACP methyl ester carboxylesterase
MTSIRRLIWRILGIPAIALTGLGLVLVGCQGRIIYHPSPYRADLDARLPKGMKQIVYVTDQGRQVAFWLPPSKGGKAERIWMCFSGNAAHALDWLELAQQHPDGSAGFLMIDYPGYGRCEGSSTPGRILASSEAAMAALAAELGETVESISPRMGTLGHSLGAACALQFAARHPVQRVVLVAPFTSMVAMGHHLLFWPMGQFVWHRFDNSARLDELAARDPKPSVVIIHGALDEVIPVTMGRSLATAHPGMILYHEIPNGDHNDIIETAREVIISLMMGRSTVR